ncbi:hypothetical protein BV22DRAFT_536197 [Leucogyrophana mollusca]|uniref:Uncharacterized protein n=1 Tax=Leucogyrophana mollusca TaxID=85980 RepID=A0ACB8BE79_9AGAM|nr:hypothetical protein BV22DRAFT_536197 [Leucogyrophana mollusca]
MKGTPHPSSTGLSVPQESRNLDPSRKSGPAFSPTGKWGVASGRGTPSVLGITHPPDMSTIKCGIHTAIVQFRDAQIGPLSASLKERDSIITSTVFSPDAARAVFAHSVGSIQLWSILPPEAKSQQLTTGNSAPCSVPTIYQYL